MGSAEADVKNERTAPFARGAEAAGAEAVDDDGLGSMLGAAGEEIRRIGRHLERLLELQADKARLGLRAWLLRGLFWGLLSVAAMTLAIAASLRLIAGLSHALAELFGGRPWAGDLIGGLVTLIAIWGLVGLVRARSRRRELARLETKYARADPSSSPEPGPPGARSGR